MLPLLRHSALRQAPCLRPALLASSLRLARLAPLPSRSILASPALLRPFATQPAPPTPTPTPTPPPTERLKPLERRENPYTIPNAITVARMAATPVIGHFILQGELGKATALLFVAGFSDLVDGWLARKYNMGSVLGSILDPAADKLLMTTMVVTLAMKSMIPLPLAVLIIGRDAALALSAFYFRYASLPPPKTFSRYWDFSIPSAEVKPTALSKYNTALQLLLVGSTTVAPLLPYELGFALECLQWTVAATTVGSGLSYVFGAGVKYVK